MCKHQVLSQLLCLSLLSLAISTFHISNAFALRASENEDPFEESNPEETSTPEEGQTITKEHEDNKKESTQPPSAQNEAPNETKPNKDQMDIDVKESSAKNSEALNVTTTTGTQCNQFTFDASKSYDPDNQNLSYQWDLGDSTTSTEPIITHTYAKSGKYTVKLLITDNTQGNCSTAASAQVINVNIPPKGSFDAPEHVCVNQEINLQGYESQSDKPKDVTFWWEFGDGNQKQGRSVSHTYTTGGDYNIVLVVDDNAKTGCSTDRVSKKITVNAPPVANAGQDILITCVDKDTNQAVVFDASGTTDINGDKLSYVWDFGDGETGDGKTISHLYRKSGRYEVKLKVKDDSGLSCNASEDTLTVNLNRAPVAKAGEDKLACVGDPVEFNGTPSSVDGEEVLFSKWTFGDGAYERGLKVQHIYAKPGRFQATLTVENAHSRDCPSSSDMVNVEINSAPVISLKPSHAGCVDEEISFDAAAKDPNGDKLEYFWSFGDGSIYKGGPKGSHKFAKGGNYKVTVIADDGRGAECSSVSASTMVKVNSSPVANAGENTACCMGESTVFNGMQSSDPDGDNLSYHWDFGDGDGSSEAITNHTYSKGGVYNVRLTVDDNSETHCSSDAATFKATINQTPVPIIQVR